jgi:hypothetical protein
MKLKTFAKMVAELAEKYPNAVVLGVHDGFSEAYYQKCGNPMVGRVDGDYEQTPNGFKRHCKGEDSDVNAVVVGY